MTKSVKNKKKYNTTKKSSKNNIKKLNLSKKNKKGGHKYTRKLLKLTSRTHNKENFISKETIDSFFKEKNSNIDKLNTKKYAPHVPKKDSSGLNNLDLNNLDLINSDLNNLKLRIDAKSRKQRIAARKAGTSLKKEIKEYEKYLSGQDISKEEYNKMISKFISSKMAGRLSDFNLNFYDI